MKNFNMKVNIKQEQNKMKKNMRKIGDRSGIGFAEDEAPGKKRDVTSEVDAINHKIKREAQMMIS